MQLFLSGSFSISSFLGSQSSIFEVLIFEAATLDVRFFFAFILPLFQFLSSFEFPELHHIDVVNIGSYVVGISKKDGEARRIV